MNQGGGRGNLAAPGGANRLPPGNMGGRFGQGMPQGGANRVAPHISNPNLGGNRMNMNRGNFGGGGFNRGGGGFNRGGGGLRGGGGFRGGGRRR